MGRWALTDIALARSRVRLPTSAYFAVACISIDGLIIALVMKYADNILKGFATSAAICMTAAISVMMGDMAFSQ